MYKIAFFVPASHLEKVKDALFNAGAGRIGNYDCCAWETKGVGQFRALEGSNPYIGEENKIEKVDEFKVEMVCDDALVEKAIAAMRLAHPYEEPAYDVWSLEAM